jgi:hypothetical protein
MFELLFDYNVLIVWALVKQCFLAGTFTVSLIPAILRTFFKGSLDGNKENSKCSRQKARCTQCSYYYHEEVAWFSLFKCSANVQLTRESKQMKQRFKNKHCMNTEIELIGLIIQNLKSGMLYDFLEFARVWESFYIILACMYVKRSLTYDIWLKK